MKGGRTSYSRAAVRYPKAVAANGAIDTIAQAGGGRGGGGGGGGCTHVILGGSRIYIYIYIYIYI